MIENTRSLDRTATLILLLGMLFILLPLYLAVVTASQSYQQVLQHGLTWYPGDRLWFNLQRVWHDTPLPGQLANSMVVALMVAAGKCLLSFMAAYALVYFRLRYASLLFALILATVMLPIDIRVITTYQVASNVLSPINSLLDISGLNTLITQWVGSPVHLELNVLNTHFGLAAPLIAHGTGTFLFRQFFRTLPQDLVKAAKMDGAGPWHFMIDILLPLSRTPFIALFILMFLGGWTQYLWPLVASSTPDMQTAVIGLARLAPDSTEELMPDFPLIMAGVVMVSLIPLLLIAALQGFVVRGLVLTEK